MNIGDERVIGVAFSGIILLTNFLKISPVV